METDEKTVEQKTQSAMFVDATCAGLRDTADYILKLGKADGDLTRPALAAAEGILELHETLMRKAQAEGCAPVSLPGRNRTMKGVRSDAGRKLAESHNVSAESIIRAGSLLYQYGGTQSLVLVMASLIEQGKI